MEGFQNLVQLFRGVSFKIPEYQRGYQWGEREVQQFWEDLRGLREGQFHYTGAIVLNGESPGVYRVIDGQQRLVTSLMGIRVLVERLKREGVKRVNWKGFLEGEVGVGEIEEIFFFKKGGVEGSFNSPSIQFSDSDFQKVFNWEVLGWREEFPDRETLYSYRFREGKDFLQREVEKCSAEEVQQLLEKLVTRFLFTIVEVGEGLEEYQFFEALNYRGKPLSKLELLKSRLLHLVSNLPSERVSPLQRERLKERVKKVFQNLYYYFGKNPQNLLDEEQFLNDHTFLFFGTSKLEWQKREKVLDYLLEGYFSLKNLKGGRGIGPLEIEEYLFSLNKGGVGYYYLHNPSERQIPPAIGEWMERLLLGRLDSFAPLLMEVFGEFIFYRERFGEREIEEIVKLLRLIEWFKVVVVFLEGRRSDIYKKEFLQLATQYRQTRDLSKVVSKLEGIVKGRWDRGRFISKLSHLLSQEGWSPLVITRYILYRYQEALFLQFGEETGRGRLPCPELSIEHILPKKWKSMECWKELFPFPPKEVERYLHSIGNLLLIPPQKNTSLQNSCFSEKRKRYRTGSLLEMEVAFSQKWGPTEIYNRGVKILRFVSEEWELSLSDAEIGKLLNLPHLPPTAPEKRRGGGN
jgi:hypothetical protein